MKEDLYCDESVIKELQVSFFDGLAGGDEKFMIIWNGNYRGGQLLRYLNEGSATGFYKSKLFTYPLYLPKGHFFFPFLRAEFISDKFHLNSMEEFTIIYPYKYETFIIKINSSESNQIRKDFLSYEFKQVREDISIIEDLI